MIWLINKAYFYESNHPHMLFVKFIKEPQNMHIDPSPKIKKNKLPTYLPTLKNLGRVTANQFFFKGGLIGMTWLFTAL